MPIAMSSAHPLEGGSRPGGLGPGKIVPNLAGLEYARIDRDIAKAARKEAASIAGS